MIMYNIEAAKELLAHYKSLTLTQLEHEWNEYEKEYEKNWENFPGWCKDTDITTGGDVMSTITGFGTTGSCSLCNACKVRCEECIYCLLSDYDKSDFPCLDKTYTKMDEALNPEQLYEALQFRIERLEKAIKVASIA